MALIVEDGTGLANAESYASVAETDTYHSDRGEVDWAALTTAEKEQALRRATDFMVQSYRQRWLGYRRTSTQRLDWPRSDVPINDGPGGYGTWPYYVSDTIVPAEVKSACAELALRAAAGPLLTDTGRETVSESVGELSVTYRAGAARQTGYESVERALRPYLRSGPSTIAIGRA